MIQLLGDRQGYNFVPGVPKTVESFHKLFTNLSAVIAVIPTNQLENLFFVMAHHKMASEDATTPIRFTSTFDYQEVMGFDIDGVDSNKAFDYLAIVARELGIPREAFYFVNSGYGLHLYVYLSTPITKAEYFRENKKYYTALCDKLTQFINESGLHGHLDKAIFDAGRIMRLPGSLNNNVKKSRAIKRCEILQLGSGHFQINLQELSGITKLEEENISPEMVRRLYPTPDLAEIVKECVFVKEVLDAPEKIKEPQAFDFFSIMYPQSKETRIEHQGNQKSAVELSKWVFDNAVNSSSLQRSDFSVRWEGAGKYGPRKCSTIKAGHASCDRCRHSGLIESPISLKSKEHIGSAGTGYWVLNKNGKPLHPHYADLVKVFKQNHNLYFTEDGRLFVNSGSNKYTKHEAVWAKILMERTVTPTDNLMEHQCAEFVNKLKRQCGLSTEDETLLFEESIKAKLNYKNGVLDVMTGEFIPYHAGLGFKYSLPYDYNPKQDSPFFMQWLSEIMCEDKDLIETTLDVMAYCLWPEYNDHLFVMLQGVGANGKSTLLNILEAILGSENVSHSSLNQLVTNRFAKASLEGKMANLSEEGSGVRMYAGEINTLKDLSCGGTTEVEPKGKPAFDMVKTAKLLFAVNKAPDFRDIDDALKRRLIVIPFNKVIKNLNANIEKQLIEEAPGIANMLAQRMRENVSRNEGVFKVTRSAAVLQEAQQRMLSANKNVARWAEDAVVHTKNENDYVLVEDAFASYVQWCQRNNEEAQTRIKFTMDMQDFVLPDKRQYKVKNIKGSAKRVFEAVKSDFTVSDMVQL